MWKVELDESQAEIKITGTNIKNLRYVNSTTLMAECEEELKSLLMRWKERVKILTWNNIHKTKIIASGLITLWQMGRKWKLWKILFSLAPKSLQMVPASRKLKDACSLEKKLWQT